MHSNGMGVQPISAGAMRDHLEVTGMVITPWEASCALQASRAFVDEFHLSNGRTSDPPWDWPKSKRDLEIFDKQQQDMIDRLMRD